MWRRNELSLDGAGTPDPALPVAELAGDAVQRRGDRHLLMDVSDALRRDGTGGGSDVDRLLHLQRVPQDFLGPVMALVMDRRLGELAVRSRKALDLRGGQRF